MLFSRKNRPSGSQQGRYIQEARESSKQCGEGSEGNRGRVPEPRDPSHSSAGVRTQVLMRGEGTASPGAAVGLGDVMAVSCKGDTKELARENIPKVHRESEGEGP